MLIQHPTPHHILHTRPRDFVESSRMFHSICCVRNRSYAPFGIRELKASDYAGGAERAVLASVNIKSALVLKLVSSHVKKQCIYASQMQKHRQGQVVYRLAWGEYVLTR